jgi:hypothetical protein
MYTQRSTLLDPMVCHITSFDINPSALAESDINVSTILVLYAPTLSSVSDTFPMGHLPPTVRRHYNIHAMIICLLTTPPCCACIWYFKKRAYRRLLRCYIAKVTPLIVRYRYSTADQSNVHSKLKQRSSYVNTSCHPDLCTWCIDARRPANRE